MAGHLNSTVVGIIIGALVGLLGTGITILILQSSCIVQARFEIRSHPREFTKRSSIGKREYLEFLNSGNQGVRGIMRSLYGWVRTQEGCPLPISTQDSFARIDLRGYRLVGVRLPGAKLMRADLRGTNLRGAVLAGADLTEAVFNGSTILLGADLSNANLSHAEGLSERLLSVACAVEGSPPKLPPEYRWLGSSCDTSVTD